MVQWLRFCASNAAGMDSIPGWGTKIHTPCGVAKKKKLHWLYEYIYHRTHTHTHTYMKIYTHISHIYTL